MCVSVSEREREKRGVCANYAHTNNRMSLDLYLASQMKGFSDESCTEARCSPSLGALHMWTWFKLRASTERALKTERKPSFGFSEAQRSHSYV